MIPGFAVEGSRLATGLDTLRTIDRIAGWESHADADGDGVIEAREVVTTPRSLLWKIQAAQAAADAGFLAPTAPDAPQASVIPGDGQAIVVWQKSTTETTGDPYFAVASNPATPLYDPSFRLNDVEGYRVWRGRSPSDMRVIAEYDYDGTTITDHTGQFASFQAQPSSCAPELGVTSGCPVFPITVPLASDVVQYRLGDRLLLSGGSVGILHADTAVTGGNSGLPALVDNGVPFVYVDSTVRNGDRWFYAVTAFDVNSVRSGASSLESPLVVHDVMPRAASSNSLPAVIVSGLFGADDTQLDPALPMPRVDPATGTFTGPIPPANFGGLDLPPGLAELLADGEYVARVDSVGPGFIGGIGDGPTIHLTMTAPGASQQVSLAASAGVASLLPAFNSSATSEVSVDATVAFVQLDSARALRAGVAPPLASAARMPLHFRVGFGSINAMSVGTALSQGRYASSDPASRYLAHSRWMDGAANEPADPTIDWRPSKANNSGTLTGVDSIWAPTLYRALTDLSSAAAAGTNPRISRNFRGWIYSMVAWYPADFYVTWGAGGAVTVRDSTHRTSLPFTAGMGSGYGFVSLANIVAAGLTAGDLADGTGAPTTGNLSYHSLYSVDPVCRPTWRGIACAAMVNTTALQPVDFNADGTADGNGILLVINGEPFLMKMAALPAAGTVWHLRAVGGRGMTAACTPTLTAIQGEMTAAPTDCSGYAFTPVQTYRFPLAPGLQFKIIVARGSTIVPNSGSLSGVHTIPDPYYLTNSLEGFGEQRLRFVNLPDRAIIRIYTVSGILVALVAHNDGTGGGEAFWDLRSRTGRRVASGVYFYHVEAANGQKKVGRFTVVNRITE